MIMQPRRLGWIPQKPDFRDLKFTIAQEHLQPIKSVFLSDTNKLPLPYNQMDLGSCTSQGIGFLVHFDLLNKHVANIATPFMPSRLFIYYYERLEEGTVDQDSGAVIRDGIKVLAKNGVCPEDAWPYDISQFTVAPNSHAIELAQNFQALQYKSLDNTNKQLLVNALMQGFPIVFGMSVYSSFMSPKVAATGIVPMPQPHESLEGGHCMAIVGYHAGFDAFIVRNSWGMGWGQKGYCRIPAAYLCSTSYANDFWIVTLVE